MPITTHDISAVPVGPGIPNSATFVECNTPNVNPSWKNFSVRNT